MRNQRAFHLITPTGKRIFFQSIMKNLIMYMYLQNLLNQFIISEHISNISMLLKYTLTLITSYYNVDIQVVYIIILVFKRKKNRQILYTYISSYKTFNGAIAKCPSIFMIEINVSIVPAFKSQGIENKLNSLFNASLKLVMRKEEISLYMLN